MRRLVARWVAFGRWRNAIDSVTNPGQEARMEAALLDLATSGPTPEMIEEWTRNYCRTGQPWTPDTP